MLALLSYHDLYVIAQGVEDGWVLKQEIGLVGKCGWFTVSPLADGKVALMTCHNRYVTAPRTGIRRQDWLLRQEPKLSECGKFSFLDLGNGKFAFKTCTGRYFTAGDDSWGELKWLVIAETKELLAWEWFTLEPP
jgi:hypothetical protein